jgi:catechol 2,3-dioxygenase-like lactoylglutathione lyase family enzyme
MSWTLDHIQLAIPPGGEEAARSFWVAFLGMREVEKPIALRGRGGLWLRAGAVELHLGIERDFAPARKAHPCFAIGDLAGTAATLEQAGHQVKWDDAIAGRQRFFSACPFGNRLEFMEQPPSGTNT